MKQQKGDLIQIEEMQLLRGLHIYHKHFPQINEQIKRNTKVLPILEFDSKNIDMESVKSIHNDKNLTGLKKLEIIRSTIPAVTHVDYSARVQTVHHDDKADFYDLIKAFKQKTNCSLVVNTSFNVRGEPIVCSPKDAYTCFMRTEMDYLVMGNFLLSKDNQPEFMDDIDWREEFELD